MGALMSACPRREKQVTWKVYTGEMNMKAYRSQGSPTWLQPLLAFLGPTLNQQPLPPPTQLWLQGWRRCTFLGATLNQQPLSPPTQLWLQSWRR